MSRFEQLMDDCREALIQSKDYKNIYWLAVAQFITYVVVLLVIGVMLFVLTLIGTFSLMSALGSNNHVFTSTVIASMILIGFVVTIILLLISAIFKVGAVVLIKNTYLGIQPSKELFFDGLKRYLGRIFGTNIVLSILFFVGFVIILIPLLVYLFTIGILSGGWGMYVLPIIFNIYFGTWIIIAIHDDLKGFEAVGVGIRFAKKNFKVLFLLFLFMTMVSSIPASIGGILSLVTGPILGFMISIYFDFVIMKIYRRYKTQ